MARYVFTLKAGDALLHYEESTPQEDRMDDGLAAMGGSGYLTFWERCKRLTQDVRELSKVMSGMSDGARQVMAELAPDVMWMVGTELTATISDLDYDEERVV